MLTRIKIGEHAGKLLLEFLRGSDPTGGAARRVEVVWNPDWVTPDGVMVAKAIVDGKLWQETPKLADVLSDAGCTSDDLLWVLQHEGTSNMVFFDVLKLLYPGPHLREAYLTKAWKNPTDNYQI